MQVSLELAKLMNEGKLPPDVLRLMLERGIIDLSDYITAMSLWDKNLASYDERTTF